MDRERAKLILSAHRFDEPDHENSELREARGLARTDHELGLWMEEQTAIDKSAREAFQSIRPPADLKKKILAAAKPVAKKPPIIARRHKTSFRWDLIALTASIAIIVSIILCLPTDANRIPLSTLTAMVESMRDKLPDALGKIDPDVKSLRAWLANHQGPHDFSLPASLAGKDGLGCQVFSIKGNKVSLVCVQLGNDRVVHYFVVDRKNISHPPKIGETVFMQENGTSLAIWSDQDRMYVLAEFGDTNRLKDLL